MNSKAKLILVILLLCGSYISNPQVEDYQNKANEIFAEQVEREAAKGNVVAKIGKVLGAKKIGEFLLRVERHDLYLASYSEVYTTTDSTYQGIMIGAFGQIISFPTQKNTSK